MRKFLLISSLFLCMAPFFRAQNAYVEMSRLIGLNNGGAIISDFYNNTQSVTYGDKIYIAGEINNPSNSNFPSTNGTQITNLNSSYIFLYVCDTLGNPIYSTVHEASITDISFSTYTVENGNVYLTATVEGNLLSTTNGSTALGGVKDVIFIMFDNNTILNNGSSISYSTYLGGSDYDENATLFVENGNVYSTINTTSTDIYVTNGSQYQDNFDSYVIKISSSCIANNSLIENDPNNYATYLGGDQYDADFLLINVESDNIYIVLGTYSSNITTTNGTQNLNPFNNTQTVIYKISSFSIFNDLPINSGPNDYCSILESDDHIFVNQIKFYNNKLYVIGELKSSILNTTTGINSSTIDQTGFIAVISDNSMNNNALNLDYFCISGSYSNLSRMDIYNGYLYIAGDVSTNVNTTNGSQLNGSNDILIAKIDLNSIISNLNWNNFNEFLILVGGNDSEFPYYLEVNHKGIALLGITSSADFPITNGTTVSLVNQNNYFLNFCNDGTLNYSTILNKGGILKTCFTLNNSFYCLGNTFSSNQHLLTSPTIVGALSLQNIGFSKISFFEPPPILLDTISPPNQTVCQYGLAQVIEGNGFSSNFVLPDIYFSSPLIPQYVSIYKYQWQTSPTPAGPWSNISNGILEDYLPTVGTADAYYRRLIYMVECGDTTILSTSNVSSVLVNNLNAPTADAGGVFHTCPSAAIIVGGSPTATGGVGPYTYEWDFGLSATPNPSFSPSGNALLTLTVTDALGCKDIDQAVVYAYSAIAGPDVSVCNGQGVTIGSPPVQGLAGVSYLWSPATNLSCSTCPQPISTASTVTNHMLTLSVPMTGGGTCQTTDNVIVTPVTGPTNPNFAGNDVTFCFGGTAQLGTAPQAGFTYNWYPGTYLSSTTTALTTYDPGNINFPPVPDPGTYYLSANKNGCSFLDEVVVNVIRAYAGLDGCGPRVIGTTDVTPNINETYSWTLVSGPGSITGPTNTPTTTVTSSVGGASVYQLTVSFNGVTCIDQVVVSSCGCANLQIYSNSTVGCPSYLLTNDSIQLYVGAPSNYASNLIYSWSPNVGLSSYNTQTVTLQTNAATTYYVTITDPTDATFFCVKEIDVNMPVWSIPVFPTIDTVICQGQSIQIGAGTIPNYTYSWLYQNIEVSTSSNPLVFPANVGLNQYDLTVTNTQSLCEYMSSSDITVEYFNVVPGSDWYVCENDIIQLGGTPSPTASYLWDPPNAPWINGTNNTSPQPEVIVATDITFTVTATSNFSGCESTDEIDVFVDQMPVLPTLTDIDLCRSESAQIGNPAINGLEYSWFPATGLSCTNCAQPIANPTTTTTYTLTVSLSGNCNNSLTQSMTVNVIGPILSLNDINFCPSAGPFNLWPTGPYTFSSYLWAPSNVVSSTTIANPTSNVQVQTEYFLSVTDINGCSYTDTIVATPNVPLPNAGINQAICFNSGSTLIGDPLNSGTVTWSPATHLNSSVSPTPIFTPPSAGTYNFTISQTIAGCTATDQVQVVVNELTLPTLNSQFICSGTCVEIGVPFSPGLSYNWSPSIGLNSTSASNPSACPIQTTTYTLIATGLNGCTNTQYVTIAISDSLAPVVSIPDIQACLGETGLIVTPIITPATGNYTYSWSPSFGLSNSNIANPEVFILSSGQTTYQLNVINQLNGCSNSADFNLNVVACPNLDSCEIPFDIISLNDTICSSDVFQMSFQSDSTNVSYQWTVFQNGVTGAAGGSGSTLNQLLSTSQNQTGTVIYTIAPQMTNCFGEPQIYTVTVIPSPIVSIVGNLNYCQGDSAILASSIQGSSYLWSNGAVDSASYFTNLNNPITLSVTNEFGCEGVSSPIQLIENSTYLILDTLSICATDSILLFGNYENTAGDYRDTLSSVLGCDSIVQIHLLVSQQPNLFIALNNDTLCSGESVSLNFSSDSINASFSWIQNSNNASGASDGIGNSVNQMLSTTNPQGGLVDYIITADLFGCEADADTVSIFVAPIPMLEIIGSLYYCEGDSALLTANASYNQYVWSDGSTDSTIYATSANNPISLTATNNYNCSALSNGIIVQEQLVANFSDSLFICQGDSALIFGQYQTIGASFTDTLISNGCDSIVTIHLIVNPLPIIQLTSSDDTICQGNSVNFIASGGVNYEWNVSAVTTNEVDIAPTQSQEVIVTGFNTFGCSNTDTISLVVIENDSAYFYYDNTTFCIAGNNPILTTNSTLGGLYSSPIGISIDINTGAIDLLNSLAGTYQISYQTTGYCPSSFDTSITLVDVPDASFSYSSSSFCLDPNGNDPTIISGQISQLSVTPTGLVYDVNTGTIDLSLSQPGVYTLTNVVSIIGCPTANFDTVLTLLDLPTAIVDSIYFVCDVSVLPEIEVNLTGIGPWEINYIDPNGNTVTVQTNQTPYFISNVILGDYIITTLSDQNCSNQINKIIKVILYEGPILNPINNLTACNGELISSINFSASITAANYTWQTVTNDVGQGQNGQGSINSFTAINLTGNNIVSTIEVLASDSVCPGTSESFTITVYPSPNPIINSNQLEGCAPLSVELSSNFTTGCVWTVNSVTYQDCNPQFTLFNPGCYDVQLSVTDANQCVATTNTPSLICVFENPISNFIPSTESANLLNAGIDFDNTSINGNSYIWSIDGELVSTNENLYYLFSTTDTASYQVCLIAESNNNCLDTFCRIIEIGNSFNLYIPNAFTPHSDNINDVFVPVISGEYSEYEFRIFDRWGLEIFQTDVVNEGWDGTYLSSPVQQDVYVWKINIKDKANNKWYNLIGHVTLIR